MNMIGGSSSIKSSCLVKLSLLDLNTLLPLTFTGTNRLRGLMSKFASEESLTSRRLSYGSKRVIPVPYSNGFTKVTYPSFVQCDVLSLPPSANPFQEPIFYNACYKIGSLQSRGILIVLGDR